MSAIVEAALAAHAAGLSVVPPMENGSKRPLTEWKQYQEQRADDEQLLTWYSNGRAGLGVICGAVSGGLEMLELEGRAVAEGLDKALREACEHAGIGELLDRVQGGYCERTPSGGLHLFYRCPTPLGNAKLASRPPTDAEMAANPQAGSQVLIETRGEGGYVITAPSSGRVHPDGGPWTLLRGGFASIAAITDEERDALWAVVRTLDRVPPPAPRKPRTGSPQDDDGPIARYNAAPDADQRTLDLLVRHGWTVTYRQGNGPNGPITYLRRPGKAHGGHSATFGYYPGAFMVFTSTGTGFDVSNPGAGHAYDPAGVLAVLEHGGDFKAMGKALAEAERNHVDWGPPPRQDDPPDPEEDGPDSDGRPADDEPPEDDFLERHGVRPLADIPADPPPPLLIDRLHPTGHTVLYGDGDTGKGVLASWWIVQLTRAGHRVLIVDFEDHPDEWSSRIRKLGGGLDAVPMVHHVSPLSRSWTGERGPLWKIAGTVRQIAERVEAEYIVVDSIVPACYGYDSLKPEVPGLYAEGLQVLGLPVLSLAHATKSGEDRWPFGSVFWHNLARVTWSARKVGGGGHQVLLKNRKHNQSAGHGRLLAVITWMDDLPGEVDEKPYAVKLAEAIRDVFEDGTELLTITQVVDRLNDELDEDDPPIKANSVRVALKRGLSPDRRLFRVQGMGKDAKWGLAA